MRVSLTYCIRTVGAQKPATVKHNRLTEQYIYIYIYINSSIHDAIDVIPTAQGTPFVKRSCVLIQQSYLNAKDQIV